MSPDLRLIKKLEEKVKELEGCHADINNIYSSGAVEGYSDEPLGLWKKKRNHGNPRQERQLMEFYKTAMKALGPHIVYSSWLGVPRHQDSLAIESRSRAIPLPKAKADAKAKPKAKAKANAAGGNGDEEPAPPQKGKRQPKAKAKNRA